MHENTDSIIRRYARKAVVRYSYSIFAVPTHVPEPAISERRGLRLVVHNDSLPNPHLTSPHYHTGE